MVTDTVGDFIIRIKNGYMAKKHEVRIPYSTLIGEIGDVLVKENYIAESKKTEIKKGIRELVIVLRYTDSKPAIENIQRLSKPGIRIYAKYNGIPKVLSGYGMVVLSTPKGILTGRDAYKKGVGGELLFKVW